VCGVVCVWGVVCLCVCLCVVVWVCVWCVMFMCVVKFFGEGVNGVCVFVCLFVGL